MVNKNNLYKVSSPLVIAMLCAIVVSCTRDRRLDKIVIHDNALVKIKNAPEVLLDSLNNATAPVFLEDRILFAESGKGVIYEYRDKKMSALIDGFKLDNYQYPISVLGMTLTPDQKHLLVTAAQDSGHIFLFDKTTFPTSVSKAREVKIHLTEESNPFGILVSKGILVASGGTKSVYEGQLNVIDPAPLLPVFDVPTGVEGMTEDIETGYIYGAVVGTGKDDGYLIQWNPADQHIEPLTLTKGFTNFVGVIKISRDRLLTLEFGEFGASEKGRLSVVDLKNPQRAFPLLTGLDSPSGFALAKDNTLVISTFGKAGKKPNGMLIKMTLGLNERD